MRAYSLHKAVVFSLALVMIAISLSSANAYIGAGMMGHPMAGAVGRTISLGSLTLTGVYPRIFTPNGDGFNDKVGFHFDNPEDLPVTGSVYNLAGAKVADLQPTTTGDPASLLLWDGKDSGGKTAPAGIYLYKIEFQGQSATGSVVLAR